MDIENITLINTDSFMLEVREGIIAVIVTVIAAIIVYYLIEKRREASRIKREEERIQKEKLEQEEAKKHENSEHARDMRCKELQGYIHKHNQDLIDVFIKPWYEHDRISVKKETLVIEHLKSGYANTSGKLWIEYNNLKKQISEDRKKIKESIVNKFGGLPPDFEWEPKPYAIKRIVYEILEEFFQKAELPEDGRIKDSKEFVEEIIKDRLLYERFEAMNKNRRLLDQKSYELKQGFEKIVNDFDKWDAELEGTCEECKPTHEELKSLQ